LDPRRPDRERAQVRARDRGVHQLLAEDLRQRVGVLRLGLERLVDRGGGGEERPLRERHPRDGLRGDVDEAVHAHAHARLDQVERREQVVREDLVRRVARRLGQRGAVDDDVGAAHRRERVAGIGEIGLEVVGAVVAALVDGGDQIAARDAMPGLEQIVDRGRADLPARPGDEDVHGRDCYQLRAARSP
jgi:hypothetical protein